MKKKSFKLKKNFIVSKNTLAIQTILFIFIGQKFVKKKHSVCSLE